MLRRIEATGVSWLHRMDWEGAMALGRKALGWFALAGGMFLLCRAEVAPGLAPFAMAFMAAALMAGRSAAALLAGCLAGAVNGPLRDFNLRLPIGAAIVLGGAVAWDLLEPTLRRHAEARQALGSVESATPAGRLRAAMRRAPRLQARSPNAARTVAVAALAGSGVLAPGLAGCWETLWPDGATVAAASVAAVAAAPFFRSALEAGTGRRWLTQEERAGALMLLGLPAAGLAKLSPGAGLLAGCALALLLYPGGAMAGVCVGGALAFMAGDSRLLAFACAGGAMAQLCGGMGRNVRAAAAGGAMLAVGLMLNAPPLWLAGAGASPLLAIPLPEAWAEALARLARPAPDPCDPQRLAVRLRQQSAQRLRAMGDAFGELAEGYLVPASLPDEQALLQRLRDRLCAGCPGYEGCWTGERGGGARLLCDLIARAVTLSGEETLFGEEASPELTRRCRRGRLIPERLGEPLEDFARARRSELKRGAENRLISAQFLQARRLLDGLARRQSQPLKLRSRQALRAAAALERAGVGVESVTALGGGGVEIAVALREGEWTRALARIAAERLSRTFGRVYAPAGPLGRELRFVRRPRLRARIGAACASREAGVPSGDSHLACMLDGERLLALVCDGMGSGPEAARESAVAVRLLGRFLRAGASAPLAVETVNALLLNRGGEDMFATADMLIVDLSTGRAEFTKLAACPTLVGRAGEVRRVEGGRLPLGILERVRPGGVRAHLAPGDVLLMVSDGVWDAAGPEALEALLVEDPRDMSALARRALDLAEAGCAPGRRDDMTALCVRIEGRRVESGE